MPIGNQSTQPWTPTVNTLMSMSSYKAGLDGNSSVASNTAGALYVYPAVQGLAVVVDTVFNLPQLGQASPIAFSNAASPSVFVVNLTAPLMGSYYGCVYWDTTTSTAGVVYGNSAATPTSLIPDQAWRIPLAFVLLTVGQTIVLASNIFDARTFFTPSAQVYVPGTLTANTTVNAMGATGFFGVLTYNLSGGITLTINNLRLGIPFNLMVTNGYTAAAQFKIAATTPSGASYSVVWKASGSAAAFTNMTSGPSPAASTSYSLTGSTNTGPILNLIYA